MRAAPAAFGPGDTVTFTLELRGPSLAVGGAFITSGNVGTVRAGTGLSTLGQGLAHSSPRAAQDGVVSFTFAWQAPATPGTVHFSVAALAGNGSGTSSGDSPAFGEFGWTYGCEGVPSYVDLDRDGYGMKSLGTRLHCEGEPATAGFADRDGDCDENDEKAHPGGAEVCNKKDDDCDGEVDEGAEPVEQWPDADGDGFYSVARGAAKIGCGNVVGYAASGGDCDDLNAAVHPRAVETCNERDDNCDGDVDERVRPQCGAGWCARYSSTCSALDCRPGEPREESCNSFDDDCDGELDNGVCAAPSGGSNVGGSGNGGASAAGGSVSTGGAPLASPPAAGDVGRDASGCGVGRGSGRSGALWLLLALTILRTLVRPRSRSA
jgi:hypothetical protein